MCGSSKESNTAGIPMTGNRKHKDPFLYIAAANLTSRLLPYFVTSMHERFFPVDGLASTRSIVLPAPVRAGRRTVHMGAAKAATYTARFGDRR